MFSILRAMVPVCLGLVMAVPVASAQTSAPEAEAAQVQRGKRLFIRCAACHETGEPKIVKVGPPLKGIMGRKAGQWPGQAYSKGLAAAGFDWDDERMLAWLERPTAVIPDTTMVFEGIPAAADRQALLAYLRSLK